LFPATLASAPLRADQEQCFGVHRALLSFARHYARDAHASTGSRAASSAAARTAEIEHPRGATATRPRATERRYPRHVIDDVADAELRLPHALDPLGRRLALLYHASWPMTTRQGLLIS